MGITNLSFLTAYLFSPMIGIQLLSLYLRSCDIKKFYTLPQMCAVFILTCINIYFLGKQSTEMRHLLPSTWGGQKSNITTVLGSVYGYLLKEEKVDLKILAALLLPDLRYIPLCSSLMVRWKAEIFQWQKCSRFKPCLKATQQSPSVAET